MGTESELSAENVASSFVKQYYALLEICPENVHKFYQESSQLGWAEPDGAVTSVTTLGGIDDKIMSSDYKNWSVDLKYVDAQYSKDGGVVVAVAGVLTGKDITKKNFNQTFFLAKQERGFFVLNDIFRYTDICESITNIVVPDDGKSNQTDEAAPNQNSAPSTTSICHNSAQTEFEVENGNVEEKSSPVLKESVPVNISSEASHEDTNSTLAPVPITKEDSPKISYASILAKANHASSPKSVSIPPKADYKAAISTPKADYKTAVSTPKASSPPGNGSSKVANSVTNASYIEGHGIYIGKLPYDVTKQAIAEEVKKFGPVRRGLDSIQIRRHEDGFCCGFVEFESADSARLAVEAHRIYFGEKESYISYKKASNQGNNKGKGRSPSSAQIQNNYPRGRDTNRVTSNVRFQNGNHSGFEKGQARDAQPSRQAAERW